MAEAGRSTSRAAAAVPNAAASMAPEATALSPNCLRPKNSHGYPARPARVSAHYPTAAARASVRGARSSR